MATWELGSEWSDALNAVLDANRASIKKHGLLKFDNLERTGLILCEECGEVAAELLKMSKPGGSGSHRGADGREESVIRECAQTAQHAMEIIIEMQKRIRGRA